MHPSNREIQRKPRKGDLIGFGDFASVPHSDPDVYAATQLYMSIVVEPTRPTHVVDRCDGNLCWITPIADASAPSCGCPVNAPEADPAIYACPCGGRRVRRAHTATGEPSHMIAR